MRKTDIIGISASRKDKFTVSKKSKNTIISSEFPDGVSLKEVNFHVDDRGMICEMYDPRWNWHKDKLVYCYFSTIRPQYIKGWAVHLKHDDRYFIMSGEIEVVLYDGRKNSPTFKMLSKIYLTDNKRQLLCIPKGIWHADRNIGDKDAMIVNFPTLPYNHTNPDKFRLPLDNDIIPHKFHNALGG